MNRFKHRWIWFILIGLLLGSLLIARSVFTLNYPPPRPGTGAVIGRLDLSLQDTPLYNAQDLYLARLVEANQPNAAPVVAFTYSTDPHTVVHDPDGRFAFTDVAPGTYALIIWHPGVSLVIESPEGGLTKVTVEADKTIDLGTIVPR